jgi:ATP-dependent Clp protease ATP-binding subunit ClpC
MTSNIGAHLMREGGGLGFATSEQATREKVQEGIKDEVQRFFRPEFLNRIDEIVTFNPLTKSDLYRIIDLELHKVEQRLATKKLVLHLSDAARDFLIQHGHHPEYGARPLRRCIERHVEDRLAEELLKGNLPEGSLVEMTYEEGQDGLGFNAIPPDPSARENSDDPAPSPTGGDEESQD